MNSDSDIAAMIHAFIADELLMGQGVEFLGDDALIEEGVIDSLGLLEIVTYIETEFDVLVDDADVTLDIFGTVNTMAAHVSSMAAAR